MGSLSDFKNGLSKTGLSRNNAFVVEFNIPHLGLDNKMLTNYVQSVTLPAHSLQTFEVSFRGNKFKIPTYQDKPELSVTFLDTQKRDIRLGFLKLLNDMSNTDNFESKYDLVDFSSSHIDIMPLDNAQKYSGYFEFKEVYPISVSEIGFSQADGDMSTFTVTFDYTGYSFI